MKRKQYDKKFGKRQKKLKNNMLNTYIQKMIYFNHYIKSQSGYMTLKG